MLRGLWLQVGERWPVPFASAALRGARLWWAASLWGWWGVAPTGWRAGASGLAEGSSAERPPPLLQAGEETAEGSVRELTSYTFTSRLACPSTLRAWLQAVRGGGSGGPAGKEGGARASRRFVTLLP